MPKRKNLRSVICPICGHRYTLKDIKYPLRTPEDMFGYHEDNFYGGNVDKIGVGKCCREYYTYWKKGEPSWDLKDIEPVDYDKFMADLSSEMEPKEVMAYVEPPKEVAVAEEVKEEKPTETDYRNMKWVDLRRFAVECGWSFDSKFKKDDVMRWLDEHFGA